MHAADITSRALEEGYTAIVAVGGDGTVNEVLNGFYNRGEPINDDACLGFIPSGTSGDLAHTLGLLDYSAEDLLTALPDSQCTRLDFGKAEFQGFDSNQSCRLFMNEASLGFAAKTADLVNRSSKYLGGKISFLVGVFRCLASYRNHEMSVSMDGEPWYTGPVFLMSVANGRYFGGGMQIAPDADPGDGLFEVVLITALSRLDVAKHIGKIYSGQHLALEQVKVRRGKSVLVQSREQVGLELDGECTGWVDARFSVVSKGIKFLLPGPPRQQP